MEKNNKGLADEQEGEFILNESGTAVSIDSPEEINELNSSDSNKISKEDNEQNKQNFSSDKKKSDS